MDRHFCLMLLYATPSPFRPIQPSNLPPNATVGSLALSAEIVIGTMIPIYLLEYAGVDPRTIRDIDFVAASGGVGTHLNPLAVIPAGATPPSLERVTMLATIPLLTNGIASYFLVPLSIAVGRRPVLLVTAVLAWAGGLWAGLSTSLESHLAARALMGLGAGAVEALIPLIVQDMVFIHQRNRAQAAIIASQVGCYELHVEDDMRSADRMGRESSLSALVSRRLGSPQTTPGDTFTLAHQASVFLLGSCWVHCSLRRVGQGQRRCSVG